MNTLMDNELVKKYFGLQPNEETLGEKLGRLMMLAREIMADYDKQALAMDAK